MDRPLAHRVLGYRHGIRPLHQHRLQRQREGAHQDWQQQFWQQQFWQQPQIADHGFRVHVRRFRQRAGDTEHPLSCQAGRERPQPLRVLLLCGKFQEHLGLQGPARQREREHWRGRAAYGRVHRRGGARQRRIQHHRAECRRHGEEPAYDNRRQGMPADAHR